MKDKVFGILMDNIRNPKLYMGILISIIVFLLLFPYIDANFFYYNRVGKRISILKEISDIDRDKIDNNSVLRAEYESILEEISKQKDGSLGSVFITNNSQEIVKNKFMTGAILFWFVGALCLFVKMDKFIYRIVGFVLFVVLGILFGYISSLLPTVIAPKINYLFIPILQLVLLGFLATRSRRK